MQIQHANNEWGLVGHKELRFYMQISFDLINLMATGGGISTRICAIS